MNSSNSTALAGLELKDRSVNFITFGSYSMIFRISDLTRSMSRYLTPFVAEDRQYMQLKGHPLEDS